MGPSYFLKTSSKLNLKSNLRQTTREEIRYDPKKDRRNVAFHKARKTAIDDYYSKINLIMTPIHY